MLSIAFTACAAPQPQSSNSLLPTVDKASNAVLLQALADDVQKLTDAVYEAKVKDAEPLKAKLMVKLEELKAPYLAAAAKEEEALRQATTLVAPAQSAAGDETFDDGKTTQELEAWLDKQEWKKFQGTDQAGINAGKTIDINYVKIPGTGTGGAVIVVPGNSEPSDKYAEILYRWAKEFNTVYSIDHRGQGRSTRMTSDPFKNHVDNPMGHNNKDMINDLGALANIVKGETPDEKRYLACHSMGCGITFSYLILEYQAGNPPLFSAVAANAPLVKANTAPFPYWVARLIGQAQVAVSMGSGYPPTKGSEFEVSYAVNKFDTATTDSFARWNATLTMCWDKRNAVYSGHKGLCLGDVTAGKALALMEMYDSIMQPFDGTTGKGKLNIPLLLQQASPTLDTYVMAAEQDVFCSASCAACTKSDYHSAKHNIWFHKNPTRNAAFTELFAFFKSNTALASNYAAPMRKCSWWEWFASDCVR